MLIEEAKWLGGAIHSLPASDISPLLNVGSSTGDFRTKEQPWIDEHIFAPAKQRGVAVKHLDIKPTTGVDLIGDLTDERFLAEVAAMRFQSVFCSNLLEHVPNREQLAAVIMRIVPVGGYIFVSCPYRFPYHPDPIDTLFRPSLAELAGLFPGTRIHQQAIVNGGTYTSWLLRDVCRSPLGLGKRLAGRPAHSADSPVAPSSTPPSSGIASRIARLTPWLFRRFKASCLVLIKIDSPELKTGI